MDESEKQGDLGIRGLGLIDVSSEDDCLINSSFDCTPFSDNQESKSVTFLEPFEIANVETPFKSLEEGEQESQPHESSTPERTRSGKYNLRKSLAWDNAFFTSEGFLEPEELSCMIEGTEKSKKHELPGIQEDICISTDSLSTLNSDTLTFKSIEADLFEDIRASIQKSSKTSNEANSNSKKKLGVPESQTVQSSKKVKASQDKVKPKAALKKPSVFIQGLGKATKQVSVCPQPSQSVGTNRETTTSRKPPKAQGRITPISTISTKKASLGANCIKLDKDNLKNTSGGGAPALKAPSSCGLRNNVPRPTPPFRSLSSSAATKTELTTSRSSFDSSSSGSSDHTGKISLNSMKRKDDSGKQSPSSGSTVKSKSRTASRSKAQPGGSHLTTLRAATKLSSSISPASSVSEWSSASTSSNAMANQRPKPKSTRTSLDSCSSMGVSVDSDAPQISDSHNNSNDQCFNQDDLKVSGLQREHVKRAPMGTGALPCPASTKPSGLRMPSPKIGFFDGARTAVRTPNGRGQSHSGVSSTLPRIGAGSFSPSTSSNKAKLGNVQSARIASVIQSSQQNALTTKPRPVPLQEPTNAAIKISSVSRNVKSPLISPKFQSRNSSKIGGQSLLKAADAKSKVHDISVLEIPHVLKQNVSPDSRAAVFAPGTKLSPMKENPRAFYDPRSVSDAENINPFQKLIEDAKLGQHVLKNDLYVEDQVNGLARQVGAMDISEKVEKIVTSLSPGCIQPEGI